MRAIGVRDGMGKRGAGYRQLRTADLSERQREVLRLIAKGHTNSEIAARLGISLDGAKWHVREILAKLGVDSREEAAEWWKAQHSVRRRLGALLGALPPRALIGAGGGVAAVGAIASVAIVIGLVGGDSDNPPRDDAAASVSTAATAEASEMPEGPDDDFLPGDPAIEYILSLADSSQHVFAMAWDDDERLWFVTTDGDVGAELRRYDPATGTHRSWPLPQAFGAGGPFTYVHIGDDGRIWVAAGYGIAAFDPVSESFSGSVRLEIEVPGGQPEHGGTWINGFYRDEDRLLFTRENVPALFAIDASLTVERIEAFDAAPRGLWVTRYGVEPYSLTLAGNQKVELRTGQILIRSFAESARGDSCHIMTNGADTPLMLAPLPSSPRDDVFAIAGAATGADIVAVSASGPYAVLGPAVPQPGEVDRLAHRSIVRFDCRTGSAVVLDLPAWPHCEHHPSGLIGRPMQENGGCITNGYTHSEILALAVSNEGRMAFSNGLHQVAIIQP